MSEVLASLKKKGGGSLSETTLWTNANPTSAMAQGATMPLSQNYSNFDYIKIKYRLSTSDSTEHAVIYAKEDIDAAIASTQESRMGIQAYLTNNYARIIYRPDNATYDSFTMSNARQLQGTGTSTTVLIPTQIVGLKL